MYPKLFQIYGPFELNSYNASIIIAIAVFFYGVLRHPGREKIISAADFINISIESAIAAIVGGRLLHVLSQWHEYPSVYDMLSIWDGGLSILGALFGVLTYSVWALRSKGIALAPVFGSAALYAPLMHAIARIGCFLVGCCYGAPTNLPWGVTYTNPLVYAPLEIKMHPTQLYSSLIFIGLFLLMYARKPELRYAALIYFMGMSAERFIVDFFRGDRIMEAHGMLSLFSFHQWVALAIFVAAFCTMIILRYHVTAPRKRAESFQ